MRNTRQMSDVPIRTNEHHEQQNANKAALTLSAEGLSAQRKIEDPRDPGYERRALKDVHISHFRFCKAKTNKYTDACAQQPV